MRRRQIQLARAELRRQLNIDGGQATAPVIPAAEPVAASPPAQEPVKRQRGRPRKVKDDNAS